MIPNAKICLYPRDPAEAVRVLTEHGKRALIVAGGTTAAMSKSPDIDTLVDLTRLDVLDVEEHDDHWLLGCTLRLQDLAEHEGLANFFHGMLSTAARSVGSQAIRHAVTLGGNLVQLYRWSDMPVVILALGAQIELFGPDGARWVDADDFFAKHPRQCMQEGEILTRVRVDKPVRPVAGSFVKFSRTAVDFGVVDVAVCLWLDKGKVALARVVVGATRATPWRATEAEKLITGRKLNAKLSAEAALAAKEQAHVLSDVRTDKAYRKRMVGVIVGRALEQAAALAKEQS
ncbi:MAG: FAD binding domain-containing protein [Deltaproteobacteria bacterium]|nr:FAD binding domain-containing protein [Deltaproteobacteria bacterium]